MRPPTVGSVAGDFAWLDARGVLLAAGDCVGDLLSLEPALDPRAGLGLLEPLDLAAGFRAVVRG